MCMFKFFFSITAEQCGHVLLFRFLEAVNEHCENVDLQRAIAGVDVHRADADADSGEDMHAARAGEDGEDE